MTRIEWTKRALRQASLIDRSRLPAIRQAVEGLLAWPDCRNVKALTGRDGYRLRVGRYRVIFAVRDGAVRIITIQEVKKRDDQTY